MRRALFFSVALHAALVLALLAGAWLLPGQGPKEPPVWAEVELVVQNTPAVGRAAAPPAPQASPAPAERRMTASLPLPVPASPPSDPDRASMAQRAKVSTVPAQASVQTRESASSGIGLVTGDHVIPAALDATVHNLPPAYPPRAVSAGEQGSVILRVSVAADGSAAAVDIFRSSGYAVLDAAARRAVGRWHFVPARRAGKPIPSTMLLKIRFVLTNPESDP